MIARAGIEAALAALAARRPVFHSEADFQFALAWTLRELHPDVEVRLEYPTPWEARGYIDIWLREGDGATAIELKYWTRKSAFEMNGERFSLRDQSAQDTGRYDFWKDVARIERLIADEHVRGGYVLALTNDQNYWNKSHHRPNDEAFRTHEGREVSGTLAWSPRAGAGSIKGRETPIKLRGRYVARWAPYSEPRRGEPGGAFRRLLLDAGAGLDAGR